MSGSGELYLRYCSLNIADQAGNGVELAGLQGTNQVLRIRFSTHYYTTMSPASMNARVYNLSQTTIQNILALASKNPPTDVGVPNATSALVTLKAGYISNTGDQTIFRGMIYQLRQGKENATDSYLDIFAADGDAAHVFGYVSQSVPAGSSAVDQWNILGQSWSPWQISTGEPPNGLSTTGRSRGRVLFGPTRERLRELSDYNNFTFNILNGQLQGAPVGAPLSTNQTAIEVNSQTGMIGIPEQTESGVTVTTLLNPQIRWGTVLKINNSEIAQLLVQNGLNGSATSTGVTPFNQAPAFVPQLNSDGLYVVIHVHHTGDTRNNPWYSIMTCLSIDPSAQVPLAKPEYQYPSGAGGSVLGSGAT